MACHTPYGDNAKVGTFREESEHQVGIQQTYVVGGTAADGNYSGLQKFTYATKTWETITPNANVPVVNPNQITQNRRWHSATYLKASDELLIYAGSVDGIQRPSSATYAIKTTAPYQVKGYSTTDDRVLPAIAPLLLPWTAV